MSTSFLRERAGTTKPITIVITVSNTSETVFESIKSAIEYGRLETNTLLVVNDTSPQKEEFNTALGKIVKGRNSYLYQNSSHLGLLATINRAVVDLDCTDNDVLVLDSNSKLSQGVIEELVSVLNSDEKHGVVYPRSNIGTIASIPILSKPEMSDYDSGKIFHALKKTLPKWTITPPGCGNTFLIRRTLLKNYGVFDTNYSSWSASQYDFGWRINRLGYSCLLANHAFVEFFGNTHMSELSRGALISSDHKKLLKRYPHHQISINHYLQFQVEPTDWFAERLFNRSKTKRILIDLPHVSLVYNGSTRNALSFLEMLSSRSSEFAGIEFTIASSEEAKVFFELEKFGIPIKTSLSLEDRFDLGFALTPVWEESQIIRLNRHCVKWVASHLDIIALRINMLLEANFARKQVVYDSLYWADRVVSISESALEDLASFFGPASAPLLEHAVVLHEGIFQKQLPETVSNSAFSPQIRDALKRANYILVIGNHFPHKHFPETLTSLKASQLEVDIVAFGRQNDSDLVPGVINLPAGHISDSELLLLYANAKCVIYPSTYEGFGLPTAEVASLGNQIVVYDMAVSHEVAASLGLESNIHYFTELSELEQVVSEAMKVEKLRPIPTRTLDEYNYELLQLVVGELEPEVDLARLNKRVREFRRLEIYSMAPLERSETILNTHQQLLSSRTMRLAMVLQVVFRPLKNILRPAVRGIRTILK